MIKSILKFSFFISLAYLSLFSCGGDDDIVRSFGTPKDTTSNPQDTTDPVEPILDSTGIFIVGTASNSNLSMHYKLSDGIIDDFGMTPPFSPRTGFYEGFYYLNSGTFVFKIIDSDGNEEDIKGSFAYEAIGNGQFGSSILSNSGSDFSVNSSGLYYISIDLAFANAYIFKVENFNLIGPAVKGWSEDVNLEFKSMNNDKVVFEATKVPLKNDEFKIRYNSNWYIDRTIANPPSEGLLISTNFGSLSEGSSEDSEFQLAGYNFNFNAVPGEYTVTLTFEASQGYKMSAAYVKTGDIVIDPFDPLINSWGVLGTATLNGWNSDTDIPYVRQTGNSYYYIGTKVFQTGEFKYRLNDAWDVSLGPNQVTHSGSAASLVGSSNGNFSINVPVPEEAYQVTLFTSNEGLNWNVNIDEISWGIIGDATPGGWDNSTNLTKQGPGYYSAQMNLIPGEYKFRTNDSWDYNLGGDINALVVDGSNLTFSSSGLFNVEIFAIDSTVNWAAFIY